MKFTHGAWLWKDGVTPTTIKRMYRYRVEPNRLWIAGLDRTGTTSGDRFEGLVLELVVTSPMPDVLRVQIKHHSPTVTGVSGFEIDPELQSDDVRIDDRPDAIVFTSGTLSLRVGKGHWQMAFESNGMPITEAGHHGLGYMQVKDEGSFISQRLSLGVGECLYGLGERFGPLVKNGQSVRIWNEDGGTNSDLSYKNIPFYLSNRGYGLFVNSPGRVDFEIGTERVSAVQFCVPGESLDYFFINGPEPKRVLERYTRLTGRPAVPPAWSFGLWLSTSFTTHYDEATVNEFVDGMAARGIPLSVFHFDCFWMKERQWCDFEWDSDAFPDPVGMLKRLKAKGLKICVWINPYISQLSPLFAEGREGDFLLKRSDGSVFQRDAWQCGMGLVDFTNPWAVEWYCGKLQGLLEMGVDCFKTDFGEFIPTDVVYHDGSDPKLMHNYYAYLYNKAVFQLLEGFHGKGQAMVFARSATAGSQKFPVHWGGDCDATFDAMAEDLRGGLSFCTSGPAFWSHDIGGFAGTANAALYKRWVAFGLLSTHSRLHGSGSYRVPWLFDEESVEVMRHFTTLKNRLFPYLFGAAHDAHERGWPVMRAMALEFPDDPAVAYLDRQYLLGDALLVAPVFRQDDVAEYYLPAGKWTHLITNAVVPGGGWHRETVDFMQLPLFVRENSILPMSGQGERPAWEAGDPLALHLFEIAPNAKLHVRVPTTEGRPVTFSLAAEGKRVLLESAGKPTQVRIVLRNVREVSKIVNGTLARESAEGAVIEWTDPQRPLEFGLPAGR